MKTEAIAIVAAALLIAALNHALFHLPPQTTVVLRTGIAASQPDPNVSLMVRNCTRYSGPVGHLWWKRTEVDYRSCIADPSTAGESTVIGHLQLDPGVPAMLNRYTFACDFCDHGRHLYSVDIPLGATRDKGVVTLSLPPNLILHEADALEITYNPAEIPSPTSAHLLPYVQ